MKTILIFVFSLLTTYGYSEQNLSFISWNVFLLPKPINFTMQSERTTLIAKKLQEFNADIIMLQEAFTESTVEKILEILHALYPYHAHLKEKKTFYHLLSSGLLILSKYPLKVLDQVIYSECNGADCFAAKGFLLTEVKLSDKKSLRIGVTHLQANNQPKNVLTRTSQIQQIKKSLDTFQNGQYPQLLVGDFNITYNSLEYHNLLSHFKLKPAVIDALHPTSTAPNNDCYYTPGKGTSPTWIDYFFSNAVDKSFNINAVKVLDASAILDKKKCLLSDHHPILGTFTYE